MLTCVASDVVFVAGQPHERLLTAQGHCRLGLLLGVAGVCGCGATTAAAAAPKASKSNSVSPLRDCSRPACKLLLLLCCVESAVSMHKGPAGAVLSLRQQHLRSVCQLTRQVLCAAVANARSGSTGSLECLCRKADGWSAYCPCACRERQQCLCVPLLVQSCCAAGVCS